MVPVGGIGHLAGLRKHTLGGSVASEILSGTSLALVSQNQKDEHGIGKARNSMRTQIQSLSLPMVIFEE
jgi:hypothetical protein